MNNLKIVPALAGLATLALLNACHRPNPPAPPPPAVSVTLPRTQTVTNWDEYPGHLEAVERVEIKAQVTGYLESIHFADGAEVKAGDLLFVIDPKPFQAALARAQAERQKAVSDRLRLQAEHLRAQSRAELAANDLRRAEGLRGSRAIAEEELDNRAKALREAQATLAAAEAAITVAESAIAAAQAAETNASLSLSYTRVKAPVSGRIGRRLVTAGNLVQGGGTASGTVLATLVSVDPIYCAFDVPESAFRAYHQQEKARPGSLVCELALADVPDFTHQGRVDFFDNAVNPNTGTLRVRAIFNNPDRVLVPGMFARARVPAGPPVEAMVVPAVAIGSDQGNKFVLVVNAQGVVEQKPVQAGRQHGEVRVVTSGLTPQDRVIVNGLMKARPGAKVQIEDPAKAGAAPRSASKSAKP